MKIKFFMLVAMPLVLVGCVANTSIICALAPVLPFNIQSCAPTATPTPVPSVTK
jgi:hypothetical protein